MLNNVAVSAVVSVEQYYLFLYFRVTHKILKDSC